MPFGGLFAPGTVAALRTDIRSRPIATVATHTAIGPFSTSAARPLWSTGHSLDLQSWHLAFSTVLTPLPHFALKLANPLLHLANTPLLLLERIPRSLTIAPGTESESLAVGTLWRRWKCPLREPPNFLLDDLHLQNLFFAAAQQRKVYRAVFPLGTDERSQLIRGNKPLIVR
jgi:hypothetical protein